MVSNLQNSNVSMAGRVCLRSEAGLGQFFLIFIENTM